MNACLNSVTAVLQPYVYFTNLTLTCLSGRAQVGFLEGLQGEVGLSVACDIALE